MILYHGTASKNKQSIIEKGLLADWFPYRKNWCIYLTDSIETARHYGDLILEITVRDGADCSQISEGDDEKLV